MSVKILHGDCVEVMATLAEASVDAIVTDPPYGIGFMGKAWDHADILRRVEQQAAKPNQPAGPGGTPRKNPRRAPAEEAGAYDLSARGMRAFQEFSRLWATQALRVLKPGGHLLCFASTRTYHRMVCGVEEAGFEIRDQLGWLFGSGFPKSKNLDGDWQGWGTALKPAWEPIVLARKPMRGTVAANVALHGTGALNIDGCRIPTDDDLNGGAYAAEGGRSIPSALHAGSGMNQPGKTVGRGFVQPIGRWPANILHDGSEEVLAAFPVAPGQQSDISHTAPSPKTSGIYGRMSREGEASADSDNQGAVGFKMKPGARRLDSGSAARFFYCAKADKGDRNEGLGERGNHHPTVKPTDLMRWLCRLVTPPGGLVLDPFMGSGSTLKAAELEGFSAIGIELDPAYIEIAKRRIAADAPLFAEVDAA